MRLMGLNNIFESLIHSFTRNATPIKLKFNFESYLHEIIFDTNISKKYTPMSYIMNYNLLLNGD